MGVRWSDRVQVRYGVGGQGQALVRAMGYLAQGSLDDATAHLTVAEAHVQTTPPDRRRRLRVAIASLKLSLARRRGHLAGVIEQARFLASPVSGRPGDEDIALGSDLRAVALMNLGTAETRTLELPDAPGAERHLWEGGEVGVYSPILRPCHAPGERR